MAGRILLAGALASVLGLASIATVSAQKAVTLDYEFFKRRVEPIFLTKKVGHTRCVICHAEANNAFRLVKLSSGAKVWDDEQSRRNFEIVSKLVVPGDPLKSMLVTHPLAPEAGGHAYHSGGRQFASKNDRDWKTIVQWINGAK